jgi:hypothetical protein
MQHHTERLAEGPIKLALKKTEKRVSPDTGDTPNFCDSVITKNNRLVEERRCYKKKPLITFSQVPYY